MARPIAETFRESVRHVDFFENDLVLTEDVAMPDSEAGLEYSAYVERVEDSLGLPRKGRRTNHLPDHGRRCSQRERCRSPVIRASFTVGFANGQSFPVAERTSH